MSLFKDMLKSDESLFRDPVPLDYDYMPKILKYRESEQRQFAFAIKPLLQDRSGKNILVYGAPGIGKTIACRHVLRELEDETDTVLPVYINCWKYNTAYKILLEMSAQLSLKFVTNLKTSEIFNRIRRVLNKKACVLVFDEIDKLEDFDIVYMILEEVYKKSIILITNYKDKVLQLDERILSRLNPEPLQFSPYQKSETAGILKERLKYAFVPNVWEDQAFEKVVDVASTSGDIRKGLFLMKEAGNIAEESASKKITLEHVQNAIQKQFTIARQTITIEHKRILETVKDNSGKKSGDIFQEYLKAGGNISFRSFMRKISDLENDKYITCEKVKGREGNTTIIRQYKKITDYHEPVHNNGT